MKRRRTRSAQLWTPACGGCLLCLAGRDRDGFTLFFTAFIRGRVALSGTFMGATKRFPRRG